MNTRFTLMGQVYINLKKTQKLKITNPTNKKKSPQKYVEFYNSHLHLLVNHSLLLKANQATYHSC